MSGTALPTAGRFRFVASDRTGRPWITLFVASWRPPNGVRFREPYEARVSRTVLGEPGGAIPLGYSLVPLFKLCGELFSDCDCAHAGAIEGVVGLEVAACMPVAVLSLCERAITTGQSACLNRFP